MTISSNQIRTDLLEIWQAGTRAVNAQTHVESQVRREDGTLVVGDHRYELDSIRRFLVVGGGKAAASAVAGLESALGPQLLDEKKTHGLVNVPEGTVVPTTHVRIDPVRPVAINEPTEKAVDSTIEILRLVGDSDPNDLCFVLITGGGSALLTAPVDSISLQDKVAVIRFLSSSGADIHQLNTVRKRLSRVKGGGLLQHCQCGRVVTLVISDVLGDPLDVIASGPTILDQCNNQQALEVLRAFGGNRHNLPSSVWEYLESPARSVGLSNRAPSCQHLVVGNLDVALQAAARRSEELGYETIVADTDFREPSVCSVAVGILEKLRAMKPTGRPVCWINGGEPTVELADEKVRGLGGRNQQLVATMMLHLIEEGVSPPQLAARLGFISGGTDGEDGPTDAAGAMLWPDLLVSLEKANVELREYLERNDTYHFLGPVGALFRTGATHTNVCDLRVAILTVPNSS